ncbi:MAG: LPS export ABC transporter periplasmic protein LptC [Lentisphaeraceae bacterium]|nr:LPS export ABC transporter periplasmic protein LptC [Lentisphaeraceae bacterium]
MALKATLFALSLMTAFISIHAEDQIKSKGFSVPEYDEKGKLSSLVKGKKAIILDREAILEDVVVDLYNKDSVLVLKTPHCKYKRTEKRCTSKSPVEITGKGVKINGIGFDIDNNSKRIFIRSNVKVVWKRFKANRKADDKKSNGKSASTEKQNAVKLPTKQTEK